MFLGNPKEPIVPERDSRYVCYPQRPRSTARDYLPERLPTLRPRYDQRFVQALKNLVPPKARVFHGGHNASYTILTPWHEQAVALANEFFLDFTRHHTDEPYTYPGDDRILLLQQRGRQVAR